MAYHFETLAIHAGQAPERTTGAVAVPVFQTSTYAQAAIGRHSGYEYARTQNPTREALETCVAALEGGKHGVAFASGMAAIDAVLHLLSAGDHIVAGNDVYGGTYRILDRVYRRLGLEFTAVDVTDPANIAGALRPATRLVWLESPTNPLLQIADIRAIADLAHASGARLVVDNTFASPYLQQPLALGADLVVHSVTKYIGGHSDLVGGIVVLNPDGAAADLRYLQNAVGAVPGPWDCWLALRGCKTLALRMNAHAANAYAIARYLEGHAAVARVLYPGLPSHPQHELARRQMRSAGGMVSFIMKDGEPAARAVVERTELFTLAESLGGVESLIELPAPMTHASLAGSGFEIDPALVRLSVGIEHIDDLLADLTQALQF